jgi:hypothetical protein
MSIFTYYKGVPEYQGDIRSHAKDSTSEVRENFRNHMENNFPQRSTMNVEGIQLPRQVSCHVSLHRRSQELKDIDGEFLRLETIRMIV